MQICSTFFVAGSTFGASFTFFRQVGIKVTASPYLFSFCLHRLSPLSSFPPIPNFNVNVRMEAPLGASSRQVFGAFISDISETPVALNSNLRMGSHKSTGEYKREQKLLSDPMALVVSPTMVKCRQCNREIKLSMKCAYDNFHWKTHRERCVKASKKKKKKNASIKLPVASPGSQKSGSRPSGVPHIQVWPLHSPSLTACTTSNGGSPSYHDDQPLPDLPKKTASMPAEINAPQTLRYGDGGGYWHSEEPLRLKPPLRPFLHSYPSSTVESTSYPASPPRAYDALDDYILRVHPESFDRSRYVTAAEIKNWNWSQLRPPRFNTAEDHDTSFPP
ncbi:hypothetical protein M413DRAFT_359680 [Hebeloma cylindrosporum]|uniref:Uncharacterized protein n=1 Tax=Hebeloma cylindrosporum TaxID=76867 RepID=A0A0C3C760_HEBCY|nr:hypothetical protein M413DRAFT_359680 [Hebeloma cylindrosporum h7]